MKAIQERLVRQLMRSNLQPKVKGKGVSVMNVSATIRSSARILCVVVGIGATALHEAHADSAAAAIGKSVPFTALGCFRVDSGTVRNLCKGDVPWEIQLPVRNIGWHVIDIYTSFPDWDKCGAYTTDQYSGSAWGTQISVTPEGGVFRRRFINLYIKANHTMNVFCNAPVNERILTVSWWNY